jgi:hypothetical protein
MKKMTLRENLVIHFIESYTVDEIILYFTKCVKTVSNSWTR